VAASVLNFSPPVAGALGDAVGAVSEVTAVSEDVPEVFDPGTIASGEGEEVEDSEVIRAGSFPHPAKNNETLANRAMRRVFIKDITERINNTGVTG